ncbi:MAG: YkgJ family cysteine cluster protein [Spirochaetota bacterium]
MEHHFRCTACGSCCFGFLPLTWTDASARADTFPIAFIWTAVRPDSKDHAYTASLGATVAADGLSLAVQITPTAFIPPSFPCPALMDDKRCALHGEKKPLRCRTMPLYPYREERFQGEVLSPRTGWRCDTSDAAPVIYDGKNVLERTDFDREKDALTAQVPFLRRYAEYMQKYSPWLPANLLKASEHGGGTAVTSLASFLTATREPNASDIARRQMPVLAAFAERTAGNGRLKEFHAYYTNGEKEMGYLAKR